MKNNTSVHWTYHGGSVTKYTGPVNGNKFAWDRKFMEEEEKRERRRRQRAKVVSCCKKFTAYLFSHVGLAGMVVAYSIMGGFLFKFLEAPHESNVRENITAVKRVKIQEIWSLVEESNFTVINKTYFTDEVARVLREYQREVYKAVKEGGWDGTDSNDDEDLQWSFAGALLFAVTVITTIGYGHVAPKTSWGRVVTILYALVGIPLTFLYLSNIGNFLADCFRLFYKKICCDICCCQKCEREKKLERMRMRRRKLASQRNMLLAQQYSVDRRPPSVPSEESVCHSLEDIREGTHSPDVLHRSNSDSKICPGGGCNKENSTACKKNASNEKMYNTLPRPGRKRSLSLEKLTLPSNNKPGYEAIKAPPPYRPPGGSHPAPPSYRQSVTSTDRLLPTDTEYEASDIELRETDILGDDGIRETAIIDSDSEDDKLKQTLSPTSNLSDGFFGRLGDSKETDIVDSDENLTKDDSCKKTSQKYNSLRPPSMAESVSRSNSSKSQKSQSSSRSVPVNREGSKEREKTTRRSRKEKSKSRGRNKSTSDKKESSKSPSKSLLRSKSLKETSRKEISPSKSKKTKEKKGWGKAGKTSSKDKNKTVETLSVPAELRKSSQLKRQESKKVERQASSKSQKSQASSSTTAPTVTGSDQKSLHGSDESFVTAYSESSLCSDEGETEEVPEVITKQPTSYPAVSFGDDEVTIEMEPQYNNYRQFNHQGQQMAFLEESLDFMEDDDNGKVTVPISVCLIIIAGYIFAGSVLFTLWEEWDYLTGSYFCFITLSTIGFGDIVPGMKMDAWASHQKLVLCALWLAFGLSLIAMCFNLMQEEVKEKVKWIGNKIGLLKDENEG